MAASKAMSQLLVDHHRRHSAARSAGGRRRKHPLDAAFDHLARVDQVNPVELRDELEALGRLDRRAAVGRPFSVLPGNVPGGCRRIAGDLAEDGGAGLELRAGVAARPAQAGGGAMNLPSTDESDRYSTAPRPGRPRGGSAERGVAGVCGAGVPRRSRPAGRGAPPARAIAQGPRGGVPRTRCVRDDHHRVDRGLPARRAVRRQPDRHR